MTKFLKFGAVGMLNTLITIGSFSLFLYFSVNYLTANITAYIIGMINSFIWNKNWVFQAKAKAKAKASSLIIKFIIVNLITLGINTLLLYGMVQYFNCHTSVAQLISTGIGLVINYVLNNKWTFSEGMKGLTKR
ncbi:GtrA family protein [Neobacillus sp. WH10]|uniref:GtrA family protein n=1 Tax=Neobacillus sp. WH10 TaxID=3047873 RepID=UPI0024C1B576|nr:GtrA family protein [Neobacillus sp. WH10]WHY76912.1 GtrA family protein [Neobacillus sp. WH10]